MHGTFAWYDLMTPDPAASKKFYSAVTGWGTEPWAGSDYEMWTAGGKGIGGISPISAEQRAQGIPPHWLAYVNVDDVDSAANKVRSLGGKVIVGPEEIPNVGRYAAVQDPQGGTIAIIKSKQPYPGWDGTPSVGRFTWHELMTTDYRKAFDFYRQLFGWENMGEMDSPAGPYLMFGKNGKMYGGIFNRGPEHGNMPPNWTFYANVKDLDKSIAAVKKGGGSIATGPMEVPGGDTIAVAKDPLGAMFALHKTKAAGAATASTIKAKAETKPQRAAARKSAKAGKKAAAKGRARAKKAAKKAGKKAAKKAGKKAAKKKSPARRPRPRAKARKKSRRR
jgi:hypothetical protein